MTGKEALIKLLNGEVIYNELTDISYRLKDNIIQYKDNGLDEGWCISFIRLNEFLNYKCYHLLS